MVVFEEDYNAAFDEDFEEDFEDEQTETSGFYGLITAIKKRRPDLKLFPTMDDFIDQ